MNQLKIKNTTILYFIFTVSLMGAFFKGVGIEGFSNQVNKFDYLIVLLALLFLFITSKIIFSGPIRKITLLFFIYFFISMLSSFNSLNGYFLGQAILNFKFFVVLLFCCLARFSKINITRIERYYFYIICINVIFIFIEMLLPELYYNFFRYAVVGSRIQGTDITRYTGFFFHPGPMGVFVSLGILWASARLFTVDKIDKFYFSLFTLSLFSLIMAGQRMELIACIIVIIFAYFMKLMKSYFILFFLLIISSFAMLIFYYSSSLLELNRNLLFEGSARNALYTGAFQLALENFPFGSGLGTYGSSMSINNPSAMYYSLGFGQFWWFERESYLTDTHWAMIIGESGFLSMAIYIYILYYISSVCYLSYIKNSGENSFIPLLAFMMMFFSTLISVATPVYAGAMTPLLIICFFVGLTINKYKFG